MPTIRFNLTDDQFNELHTCLDKVRSTSKQVKVSRDALMNLLIDYARLVQNQKKDVDLTKGEQHA